jgi:hypothetical protein
MKFKSTCLSAAVLALSAFAYMQSASAAPLLCEDPNVNHMYVDTSQVSSCLGAGVGNINGNETTDDFLTGEGAGSGLTGIDGGSYTQNGNTGTFSLDASLWGTWSEIAIGFKFGTGNNPDEWFVYLLNPLVTSGSWEFVNVFGKGGGLSHVQLYGSGTPTTNVPEPGTLALLGVGLLGASLARRRKQA